MGSIGQHSDPKKGSGFQDPESGEHSGSKNFAIKNARMLIRELTIRNQSLGAQ